jgi:hypothetical protein
VAAVLGAPVEEGAPPAIRREPHPVDADAVQYFMKKPHYGIPHIGVVTVYYTIPADAWWGWDRGSGAASSLLTRRELA